MVKSGVDWMVKKLFIVQLSVLAIMFFSLCGTSNAASKPLTVKSSGGNIVVRQDGEFELLIERNRGGVISQYYDLKTDPTKTTNIAAHNNQGIIYHGLYFTMFKQGGGNLPVPEKWTAQFENKARLEVKYKSPTKVLVRATGPFLGHLVLPASFDIMYTIESDPNTSGALIYIRSRIIFNANYANTMQIRQAFCLTGTYARYWYKYSQNGGVSPWYDYRPDDDYIGATINVSRLKIDPLVILYRDWRIADYILSIGPPKSNKYALMAWVANHYHVFKAGHVIENKYLVRMDQLNRNNVASLAAAYRKSDGGDFIGKPDVQPQVHIPLLLLRKPDVQPQVHVPLLLLREKD